jgi:MYXO-CTERM domain-containing protein
MNQTRRNYLQGVADWTLANYVQPGLAPGDDDDAADDDDSAADDDDSVADDDDSGEADDDDSAGDDDDSAGDDDDSGDDGEPRVSCSCSQQPEPTSTGPHGGFSLLFIGLLLLVPTRRRR